MTTRTRSSRAAEDKLLHAHLRRRGGRLYPEVPIGAPKGPGGWPKGSKVRRLDGVIVPTDAPAEIRPYRENSETFVDDLGRHGAPELVEVKTQLNRYVIGQAIAGRRMFERQYGVTPSRVVIVVAAGDPALEWVCSKEGIEVEILRS